MVGTISRRDCLKLALAAYAGWLAPAFAGPLLAGAPARRLVDYNVPIEGLGLSVRFTNVLRFGKITTIQKLLDALGGSEKAVRSIRYPDPSSYPWTAWHVMREGALMDIKERLAVFAKSGPVPYATLTGLENEVFWEAYGRLHSVKEIAGRLGITTKAVRTQLRSIYRKTAGPCVIELERLTA